MMQNTRKARVVAFYLPQFHPIPENDAWWGKGFTEWTNVTKARPQFKGHYQPHLPADLGYYDLRLAEAREAQASLAREHGIYGFCYYHYWFQGRRLLERPFNEVLSSGKPEFPFCLCWANENWTRTWDGMEQQVLMQQTYSREDDLAHFEFLRRAFTDRRYIRIGGKPLFLIYRASKLPDIAGTLGAWRILARGSGVGELFVCNVESFSSEVGLTRLGFDAAIEFAPAWGSLPRRSLLQKVIRRSGLAGHGHRRHNIFAYSSAAVAMASRETSSYLRVPCVCPSWDNTARRERGATILQGSTPDLYGQWLKASSRRAPVLEGGERLVFINAWNEWAEGNHLEPCQHWGHAYLEATRAALDGA